MMQKISVGQLFTKQHFSLRVASNNNDLGSGCASVGREVISDTRDPWFESSHRQTFINHSFSFNWVEKT